jgi:hypothetical protein
MTAKEVFIEQFTKWAADKSLEEIAEKAYEAMSKTYDMTKSKMMGDVFEHFVKRPHEERKKTSY